VYNFWQYELCDVFIELMKPVIALDDAAPGAAAAKRATRDTLWVCLETGLRLLHPFMPFVTEELWQRLPRRPGQAQAPSIMVADYPAPVEGWSDEGAEADMAYLLLVVNRTRSLRADYELTTRQRPPMLVRCKEPGRAALLAASGVEITTLTTNASLEVLAVSAFCLFVTSAPHQHSPRTYLSTPASAIALQPGTAPVFSRRLRSQGASPCAPQAQGNSRDSRSFPAGPGPEAHSAAGCRPWPIAVTGPGHTPPPCCHLPALCTAQPLPPGCHPVRLVVLRTQLAAHPRPRLCRLC
jgi:hypothetical protein